MTLGDYVDVGPDSRGVIDRLLELSTQCRLLPVLGNHDWLMQEACRDTTQLERWLSCGGDASLASYGGDVEHIPTSHVTFLAACRDCVITRDHFFIHANYSPSQSLDHQNSLTHLWLTLEDEIPSPHFSGRTAIVGHTPQMNGRIFDLGYLIGIDTGCGYGGLLTALDVYSGTIWQVDEAGRRR